MNSRASLCLILAVICLNCRITCGTVIRDVDRNELSFTSNGNKIEFNKNKNSGSWLQMVLIFAKDQLTNQIETNSTSDISFTNLPSSSATSKCQSDFIFLGSQCYYFSTATAKWHDALKDCKARNSDLAHPLNKDENTQLVTHMKNNYNSTNAWWLGASDEATEGTWIWEHNKNVITYSDWIKNQPDNYLKAEDCLHYWRKYDWKWNDFPCNVTVNYICQQRDSIKQEPMIH
ncbi:Fc fragment of IgE, low affinity II, receptor for (CD23) [Chamberlinius hualienensis]